MDKDDDDLWHRVTRGIRRLSPAHRVEESPKPASKAPSMDHFEPAPPPAPHMAKGRDVDAATLRRIKTGKIPIEATCDLHGLTRDQAARQVKNFIMRAHASGYRLVLVITGKGSGALRRELPHWLEAPDTAPIILKTMPAPKNKGGDGATLIYLRRKRS